MKKRTNIFILSPKIAGIALVILIAMTPLLLPAFLQGKKLWAKYEMKEKLEQSRLHTISLCEGQFTWIKKNQEILVNQELFDVKEWTKKNNHYQFLGLFDKEETQIEKMIVASQNNQPVNSNKKINNIAFFIPTGSIPPETKYFIDRNSVEIKYFQLSTEPYFTYLSIDGPPPRL